MFFSYPKEASSCVSQKKKKRASSSTFQTAHIASSHRFPRNSFSLSMRPFFCSIYIFSYMFRKKKFNHKNTAFWKMSKVHDHGTVEMSYSLYTIFDGRKHVPESVTIAFYGQQETLYILNYSCLFFFTVCGSRAKHWKS